MAIVRAIKTGAWSDPTLWNTGALPTAADDVYSNTFNVTIDISPTVLSIQNGATTGVSGGGSFIPTNGMTLTVAGAGIVGTTGNTASGCLQSTLTAGQSCTIVGNSTSTSTGGHKGTYNASSGTITLIGNCNGGLGSQGAMGVTNASTGRVDIIGNCTGRAAPGAQNLSTGTMTITGTIAGGIGPAGYGATNDSTGTLIHVGVAQASAFAPAIGPGGIGQNTILSGPLLSTDSSAGGAAASGVNPCIALRWFIADNALSTFEYQMRGQTVSGTRPPRQLFLPDAYSATYPVTADVRSGVGYGPSNIYSGTCAVPSAASVLVGVPVDATTGTAVVSAQNIRQAVGLASPNLDTQLSALVYLDAYTSSRLPTASYTTPPSAATIATAVVAAIDKTGYSLTEAERSAISVAVQTGILNENDGQQILNAIVGAIGNSNIDQVALVAAFRADIERAGGTLATRLAASAYTAPPAASAVAASVRSELATELGRMDTPVSSRLAATSYSTPPAAVDIATAVWAATTRTLTTAIDNSSTIATAVWSAVTRTITGGTVDSVANTTPIDAAEIAVAVRAEIAPELDRVSNAATTEEVADIVEGVMQP
jgi:hypothetical protein